MRIARSYSPRRRNRLPSAKCSSIVSGSTLTTSMKASIALSCCSFRRQLRPWMYERGSGEEGKEQHHERRLQRHVEVEAQRHRLDVLGRERDQQHEYDETDRPGDDAHPETLPDRLRSPLLRSSGRIGRRAVDALAQLLARLEVRHVLLRHVHLLAGLRVAAGA